MKHEVVNRFQGREVTMVADMKRRAVRLYHPSARNCVYTFAEPAVPYKHFCPMCGVEHTHKTNHLILDANGYVTVHADFYDRIKDDRLLLEFVAMKEVIPRPFTVWMPHMNASAQTINPDTGPSAPPPQPDVWQPPVVVSREDGLVKGK